MDTFVETQSYSLLFDIIAAGSIACFVIFLLLKIDWKGTKEIKFGNSYKGAGKITSPVFSYYGPGTIPPTAFKVGVLIFSFLLCSITVYFITEKLETRIDAEGIHYQMLPFQMQERTISWDQIKNVEVRDYITYNNRGGTGYNTYDFSDDYGLYIFLKNRERILIGTKKPGDMSRTIAEYHNAR